MKQLLVQADDMGITKGVSLGILESIENGIVRNTGLFTNQPAAEFAADRLKQLDGVDVGIDVNFVSGQPLLSATEVPDLVEPDGSFRSSHAIKARYDLVRAERVLLEFSEEPYDYEQTLAEARAQVRRFFELMERPPAYLHHHSLVTPMTNRVLDEVAKENDLVRTRELLLGPAPSRLAVSWYEDEIGLEWQANADIEGGVADLLPSIFDRDLSVIVIHPGYVDGEILDLSSYSVVRARDLQVATSRKVQEALEAEGVELVRYSTATIGGRPLEEVLRESTR